MTEKGINDRGENFRDEKGQLFLIRCYAKVHGETGKENYVMNVPIGTCTWCGWKDGDPDR